MPVLADDRAQPANIGKPDDLRGDDFPIPISATSDAPAALPTNIGNRDEWPDVPEDVFAPMESVAPVANIGNQYNNLRIERSGSLKAPDGKGAFWIWRWTEPDEHGKQKRRSRYGGKVEANDEGYWGAPVANIGKHVA